MSYSAKRHINKKGERKKLETWEYFSSEKLASKPSIDQPSKWQKDRPKTKGRWKNKNKLKIEVKKKEGERGDRKSVREKEDTKKVER